MLIELGIIFHKVVKNGVDVICSGEAWLIFDIVNCHVANPFPGCSRFGQEVFLLE
jgi:hypothetical protein